MARQLFGVEQGIHLLSENADSGVMLLFGAADPGSAASFDDDAEQGSIYFRTNGQSYQKYLSGTGTDKWRRLANADDLADMTWRSELVRGLTNDTVVAGVVDVTGFSDNDGATDGLDFAVGEYLIGDADGTPALFEVTVVTSAVAITVVAATTALADGDTFVTRHYFPDAVGQEGQAIVLYNGTVMIKLGDVDWDFATGINLSSGYTPGAGDISSADTVESAIQKLDGNLDNVNSLFGSVNIQSDSDLGTFTGSIISDNTDVKTAFQELETYVEALITLTASTQAGLTAEVTLDSVLVDDVPSALWLITLELVSAPERKRHFILHGGHNGHAAADAASVDDTVFGTLKLGATFNFAVGLDISGAAGSQEMRLRVSASAAINAYAIRLPNQF